MRIRYFTGFGVLVLALWAARPAQAQWARVGSFSILAGRDPATGEDRSVAMVVGPRAGLEWQCVEGGGVSLGAHLGGFGQGADSLRVEWRFDFDEPDTTTFHGMGGRLPWYLPPDDVVRFTVRARTARQLVMRPLAGVREHGLDLFLAEGALDRLPCTRGTPAPGRPLPSSPADGVQRETPPNEGTYELSAVEVLPQMRNGAQIGQLLERSIPPELRGAGITGTVTVRYRVLENGRVDAGSVTVTESIHEAMNEPVISAVQRLLLTPAKVNGRPVKVWVEQSFYVSTGQSAPAAAPPD